MLASRFSQPITYFGIRVGNTLAHTTFTSSILRQTHPKTFYISKAPGRTFTQSIARPAYRRQPFNYQTFQTTQSLFRRWRARPTFKYEIGGIGVAVSVFYISNLEQVPVSNRYRFRVVPESVEASLGRSMYEQTIQQYGRQILPPTSREHRLVQRVLERLTPHAGLPEDEEWVVHVIDSEEKNAFVIPGGKVFVFRGILDICGYTDDGVACAISHEIAHNVAHHAAERLSQNIFLVGLATVGFVALGLDASMSQSLLNLAFTLPGSRQQEAEADYIGLMMMAEACYDPSAAMTLWGAMEAEAETSGQGSPPQFLSTHPSNHNRLEKIREWLPLAEDKRARSECAVTIGYGKSCCGVTLAVWLLTSV